MDGLMDLSYRSFGSKIILEILDNLFKFIKNFWPFLAKPNLKLF